MAETDSDQVRSGTYRVNGHEFEVVAEYEGEETVRCANCMVHEHLYEDKDAQDYLELMTPECHIKWLREPDGGFRGVALRNTSGFSGRELVAVDSDGEVTDRVRVYDDDTGLLASLLDQSEWKRRERHTGTEQ
ncbi:hypothetical protein [Halosolutus gelatinilyticus]|uniref:hypothetical protein n=1 Tax=Halosolutus gelatinilyticus TaxID=2931975 RepID=UPI001FF39C00|nr:hypothetical protein [Halosolutus gelatinilyticus]